MLQQVVFYHFQCHFVDLVHYMSGNVRRDFKSNVTHLVANMIGGEKYEVGLVVFFSVKLFEVVSVFIFCQDFH